MSFVSFVDNNYFHTDSKDFKDGYASLRGKDGPVSEFLMRLPLNRPLHPLPTPCEVFAPSAALREKNNCREIFFSPSR